MAGTCRVAMRRLRLAARGPPCVRTPSVHDDGGAIHRRLQEMLIGVVADAIRHGAVTVGNHAVGRNDGVAFDGVRSNHRGKR